MGGIVSLLRSNADIWTILIYILSVLTVILLTLPVHEWAHAYVATKLGDPTPRYQGRLTLNPLAHIDPFGAICMVVFGFGWGKAVQVNARYFKNPKKGMALTALAGPLSNIIVAFISLFLSCIFFIIFGSSIQASFGYVWYYLNYFFISVAEVNVALAVFNLIPVPPLDGSKLLAAFLPDRIYYKLMQYERYLVILLLIIIYSGVLDVPISFLTNKILNGLFYIAFLPAMLF